MEHINENMNKIATLLAKIQTDEFDSATLKASKGELKELLLSLSDSFNSQINTILKIQNILRNDYKINM